MQRVRAVLRAPAARRPLAIALAGVPLAGSARAGARGEKTIPSGLCFDFDPARLQESSRSPLRQVLGVLERRPDLRLRIAGRTDSATAGAADRPDGRVSGRAQRPRVPSPRP